MVEVYAPRAAATSPERISAAIEQLAQRGRQVRLVRVIPVPQDETCFYLFEAPSLGDVREAASRSGLPCEHLAEVGPFITVVNNEKEINP